jgi:ribonuclease G
MTKELFVSSTPHETKVGLVEDDLLAEIYLERENEYTLAGSIYKGRVTRVLPGMQSAFVDIGLERDAFLYVSDFMDLGEHDEDLDETVPAPRMVQEPRQSVPPASSLTESAEAGPEGEGNFEIAAHAPAEAAEPSAQPENRADDNGQGRDGGWRGRRRRRGRRGERNFSDSRSTRPAAAEPPPSHARRENFGPPAGYQPIVLPGESISKYQRSMPAVVEEVHEHPEHLEEQRSEPQMPEQRAEHIEPVFEAAPPENAAEEQSVQVKATEEKHSTLEHEASPGVPQGEAERFEQMNVVSVFGGGVTERTEEVEEDEMWESVPEPQPAAEADILAPSGSHEANAHSHGSMVEEEIDEEEADLSSYVEELEEDAAFEELEEETHAAGGEYHAMNHEIAARGEKSEHLTPEFNHGDALEIPAAETEEEEDEEEAAIEEAQEQAEALVSGEAPGGHMETSAEISAPAVPGYTQRAPRQQFDRGRRGRRGGGRRFRPSPARREQHALPLISELLKEGQEILVQIAKEPIAKKGARITSHIALPGRFLVYMPTVNHTGVSRKIASDEERQRLKRIVISERENGHGGFIVRTAAQNCSEEELRADIRFLKNLWNEIRTRAENSKSPALIYHDLNVVERVLRDQVTSDFSAIWVDSETEYERILRFANRFQPALVKRVKLYTKETPLFDQFGLTEEIDKALKSKVWLKSGGYIVINQTEALVAIDVNTGKYVGKTQRLEDTIVKTNVDAVKEIVRQVRLRDLGGIIVVDFIDMDERRNRQRVMQALEEALRADRAPSKALQFNDFGLVAITRKRVKQSLERTIGAPCPYCTGTGYVKSVNTVCNEIYVEMRKLAKHLEHSDVMLRVNPEVAKALKANNARALNEIEELVKRTVIVKSDPALHQEQFDVN